MLSRTTQQASLHLQLKNIVVLQDLAIAKCADHATHTTIRARSLTAKLLTVNLSWDFAKKSRAGPLSQGAPMAAAGDEQFVPPIEAREELLRVLASPDFAASRQLTSFLQYIVSEALAGRAGTLKERTVAHRALGRSSDFDPRLDCVVRVVAGKLRRSLDRYYALQGASDSLCIEVPKGSYCPVFRRRSETVRARNAHKRISVVDRTASKGMRHLIVAVAPFKSITSGRKERFLADLLADGVAVRLCLLNGLEVIDGLSQRFPWNRSDELCKVWQRRHASFVCGGTVRRLGCRARLTVRLIDCHTGVLAWGAQYDRQIDGRSLSQLDDVADRITDSVRDFLKLS
jgi:TolB-like protein